jgi:hypothetical protein
MIEWFGIQLMRITVGVFIILIATLIGVFITNIKALAFVIFIVAICWTVGMIIGRFLD